MIGSLFVASREHRVVTFTVHEPPSPPSDRLDRAEALVFVKDKFSFSAAVLAPVWLLTHRLWLETGAYIGAVALIVGVIGGLGVPSIWATALIATIHLMIGFEAGSIRRAAFEREGWATLGTVTGRTITDCERRFFDVWLPGEPVISTSGLGGSASVSAGFLSNFKRITRLTERFTTNS